jgi:hypothetical protein
VHLASCGAQRPLGRRIPFGHHHHPGAHREHIAAERCVFGVRNLDRLDRQLAEELPQTRRQQRQVDDCQVVGHGRDDGHEVHQLVGSTPVRQIEDANLATDLRRELTRAGVVGAQRSPDAEQVRPQPERVAALDRAGPLDPPHGRDAGGVRPRFDHGRLGAPRRLAWSQRDGAAVGDDQRIVGVGEVDQVRLAAQPVDPDAKLGQQVAERIVLALGEIQVDRVQEAERRVVVRGTERRSWSFDQHVAQRGGGALPAEPHHALRHAPEDSAGLAG